MDEIEALLRVKVGRWRGVTDPCEARDEDTDIPSPGVDLTGFLELHDRNSLLELEK